MPLVSVCCLRRVPISAACRVPAALERATVERVDDTFGRHSVTALAQFDLFPFCPSTKESQGQVADEERDLHRPVEYILTSSSASASLPSRGVIFIESMIES